MVLGGPSVPSPACACSELWLLFLAALYSDVCTSRSSRLDFSCSESRSLVERARVGDAGVGAAPGVALPKALWYAREVCEVDWEGA